MATVKLSDGRRVLGENVSANNTVALADSGSALNQIADAKVTTLPDAAAGNVGLEVFVVLGGVPAGGPVGSGSNGSVGHEIAPHSSDKIVGILGGSGTADKSILMAKDDMVAGDYVKLRSNGVDTWFVVEASGAWTMEA